MSVTNLIDFAGRESCPVCGDPVPTGWCYVCQPLNPPPSRAEVLRERRDAESTSFVAESGGSS